MVGLRCSCHTTRLGGAACSGVGALLVRPEGEEAGRQGEDEAQPVPARRKGRSALREVPFAAGFPTGRVWPDDRGLLRPAPGPRTVSLILDRPGVLFGIPVAAAHPFRHFPATGRES